MCGSSLQTFVSPLDNRSAFWTVWRENPSSIKAISAGEAGGEDGGVVVVVVVVVVVEEEEEEEEASTTLHWLVSTET